MVTTRAKTGVKIQPMTIMIGLPIKSSANMAYMVEPLDSKRSGPGRKPWAKNAPIKIAAVALPGMPNVSVGIKSAPATALLAASEAATPSRLPLPNSSGFLDARFAAP